MRRRSVKTLYTTNEITDKTAGRVGMNGNIETELNYNKSEKDVALQVETSIGGKERKEEK